MKLPSKSVGATLALAVAPTLAFAANHREAPITALDHKADITDVYAFRSYPAGPEPEGHADPRRRPAARARERAHPLPLRSRTSFTRSRSTTTTTPAPTSRSSSSSRRSSGLPGLFTAVAGFEDGANEPGGGGPVVPPQIDTLPERRPQPAPDLHRHHGPQRRVDAHPERRRSALLRGARQRRPPHDGLPGALRPRHLRPPERHLGLRRHHRRRLLDRPRRRLRHRQLPHAGQRRSGRADGDGGRGERRTSRATPCRATR